MIKRYIKKKVDNIEEQIVYRVKEEIVRRVEDRIIKASTSQKKDLAKIKYELDKDKKLSMELRWAKVWDDSKVDIDWIKNLPGISPGRMAVGYNYIYVMTRILNEMKPTSVLDVGLGISSTLISQYFDYFKPDTGLHMIIEQDKEWGQFYTKSRKLSDYSKICFRERVTKQIDGIEYNAYDGFKETVQGKKFSVISIDGPIGSKTFSRRDILEVIPEILPDSFVIILDDVHREGEQKTLSEIEQILTEHGIEHFKGFYYGESDCCVVASADNRFFTSM